jgi:hypothetical protein
VDDQFLDWLDQCPNKWLRIEEEPGAVTYVFYKNDEDEDDE